MRFLIPTTDKRHASISTTYTESFDRISKGKFCFLRLTKIVDKIDKQIVIRIDTSIFTKIPKIEITRRSDQTPKIETHSTSVIFSAN